MDDSVLYISGYCLGAVIILYSGSRLSHYADTLAEILGWGKMFMGMALVAAITSLPELVSGLSSVRLVSAPDLAVADIVGSCAFNILIISMMDIFYQPQKPVTSTAQVGHVIAAAFGIIMLCVVALAIAQPNLFGRIGWVGGYSLIFIFLYVISVRVVFKYETKSAKALQPGGTHGTNKAQVIQKFILHSFAVTSAALFLPVCGSRIASYSGIGETFFGTLFLAATTSLPEIIVSITAIRSGAVDIAIGNVFGSNLFNIGILALDDLFYSRGPLFSHTQSVHIIPTIGAILATAIGIIGLVYKSEKKWKLGLDTAAIAVIYSLTLVLLYWHR